MPKLLSWMQLMRSRNVFVPGMCEWILHGQWQVLKLQICIFKPRKLRIVFLGEIDKCSRDYKYSGSSLGINSSVYLFNFEWICATFLVYQVHQFLVLCVCLLLSQHKCDSLLFARTTFQNI